MQRCSDCGCPLQTLDLPCPQCLEASSLPPPASTHQYAKTFNYRPKPFGYRPEVFAAEVNRWLADQSGLMNVAATFTYFQNQVRSLTINCTASSTQSSPLVQLEHVQLLHGAMGRRRESVGDALNSWGDQFPHRRRINHWVVSSAGVASDLWILFVQETEPA